MKIFENFDEIDIAGETNLTLGKFDGIHLGHISLIEKLDPPVSVFTFDISCSDGVITTIEERRRRFESLGVKYLFECPFTPAIMHLSPEAFMDRIVSAMNVRSIAVGEDFRFGKDRSGSVHTLMELSSKYGYELFVQKKLKYKDDDISSSRIRALIEAGELDDMENLLGCPCFISGKVSHGKAFGRTKKIPTINIIPPKEKLLPPHGVYASVAKINGKSFKGVSNLGTAPTFGNDEIVTLETNLFDFHEDVYEKNITVFLYHFIRPEMRFSDVNTLYSRIGKDVAAAKNILG